MSAAMHITNAEYCAAIVGLVAAHWGEADFLVGAQTRLVEDMGLNDIEIMEFVEMLEESIGARVFKPVTVNTLGELSALFAKALKALSLDPGPQYRSYGKALDGAMKAVMP